MSMFHSTPRTLIDCQPLWEDLHGLAVCPARLYEKLHCGYIDIEEIKPLITFITSHLTNDMSYESSRDVQDVVTDGNGPLSPKITLGIVLGIAFTAGIVACLVFAARKLEERRRFAQRSTQQQGNDACVILAHIPVVQEPPPPYSPRSTYRNDGLPV
ncbi:hypothetical protein CPB85DRAFT_1439205 [Mucidula mucida]|nr:hypothetical protein CPB85DRAFT_1439205 [Mucidula mucida]